MHPYRLPALGALLAIALTPATPRAADRHVSGIDADFLKGTRAENAPGPQPSSPKSRVKPAADPAPRTRPGATDDDPIGRIIARAARIP